jgi:phosphonopyruvate decarboxylase
MMIAPELLLDGLRRRGAGVFAGVPDSLLAHFCAYVDDNAAAGEHIITANEGNAIALAAGHYMATGKIPVVYMQNSGLGNAINPLTSLADREVYGLPMILVIGWRGEPGVKDEPQHIKQGRITPAQLELLEVPSWTLDGGSDVAAVLDQAFAAARARCAPVALLVRKDTFSPYASRRNAATAYTLGREAALARILALSAPQDLVVSTTGKTSREVFDLRVGRGEAQRDFLTVGGMGHTASIALGVALGQPQRRVLCLDGDGSLLMHMGALPVIGALRPANLVHVLLNNAAHESVGGQPTVAGQVDFRAISAASGYSSYLCATDEASLDACWKALDGQPGPVLLELKISSGSRPDLGRPTSTPEQNKAAFERHARGQ